MSVVAQVRADIVGLADTKAKFDFKSGCYQTWLGKVRAVKLARITPEKVQEWKRSFLLRAKKILSLNGGPRVSVSSFLRQAQSLFSPKIIHYLNVELPSPLPFYGVEYEPRQSRKYHSGFNVLALIAKARDALSKDEPELFKIFLLAVMVGLRRKEIDLWEWTFRVGARSYPYPGQSPFSPKSEDSTGDMSV